MHSYSSRCLLLAAAAAVLALATPSSHAAVALNDGGTTKLEVVARDGGGNNQIEDLLPTSLPFDSNHTATEGDSHSSATYHLGQDGITITSSGTRAGALDSRANVQPTIYFSVSSDTSYSFAGTLTVTDPSAKYVGLTATLTDLTASGILYHSDQESFGAPNQSFTLGGMAGNQVNELSGSPTGTLLAGHQYSLFYGSSIYAANSGTAASFIGSFSLEFGQGCQVNVQPLSQGNPLWAGDYLANSPPVTIQNKGCALTCLSMALNYAGVTHWLKQDANGNQYAEQNNPGTLNLLLTYGTYQGNSGFDGRNVWWGPATKIAAIQAGMPRIKFKPERHFSQTQTLSVQAEEYLTRVVCELGFPVIVAVNGATHFVLVTGKEGDRFKIADPGHADRHYLNDHNYQNFETRGYVADPEDDISEIAVASSQLTDGVRFFLYSPAGAPTGLPPGSTEAVEQISQSSCFIDSLADDVTDAPPTEATEFVHVFQPSNGVYRIVVTGDALKQFTLSVQVVASDGALQPPLLLTGFVASNLPAIFELSVNKSPGSQPTATQILPPLCNAGGPYIVQCNGASTTVRLDGRSSLDPNGGQLTYLWSSDCPAAIFDNPSSPTPTLTLNSSSVPESCNVTLTVSNTFGLSSSCSTTVTIKDSRAPVIGTVTATPPVLWPPNNKLVEVTINYDVTDVCNQASDITCTLSVTSNESVKGCRRERGEGRERERREKDDDNKAYDWVVLDSHHVRLRAEKSERGEGRIYWIKVTCQDSSGNSASKLVSVRVPKGQGKDR